MSRIAKFPVTLPKGVEATLATESLSNRNRDQGAGQAARGTSRRRGARIPVARAVQGQGRALLQRARGPERDQEEVANCDDRQKGGKAPARFADAAKNP